MHLLLLVPPSYYRGTVMQNHPVGGAGREGFFITLGTTSALASIEHLRVPTHFVPRSHAKQTSPSLFMGSVSQVSYCLDAGTHFVWIHKVAGDRGNAILGRACTRTAHDGQLVHRVSYKLPMPRAQAMRMLHTHGEAYSSWHTPTQHGWIIHTCVRRGHSTHNAYYLTS